ncbi:Myotubularin-related protein 8 [Acropora cervicornis]|uniref:Myotubularin-related protein 8 n=1 Tax=Acropora cervicornis TaxID=6130 RepID=A0AAD9V7E6_ACRCE|nr:Myotubularin-related protein 8 [Acropora cervicornis]
MDVIKLPKVENVRLMTKHGKKKAATGTLYLTATHLIFVDPDCSKETWKLPLNAAGSPLRIKCKNFHEKLTRSAGWALFDVQSEFARMGLPNSQWCCSSVNKEYQICDTYPSILYLPASVSSSINAMANKAAGKGYESTDFYENVKFQFLGIENIHVMRQSLQKMTELVCETPDIAAKTFVSGLDGSGWLKHIKAILDTSIFIAKAVAEEKISVVVHCSDGWDRTAQTCSIASIILDPYYRTIHGFQVLVEKEWLSFGHKFTDRCGFLQSDGKETSPVFLQFLEGVWQLLEQFPFAFQFNERFLLTLHDHLYSCQFGTFLGNCERERKEHRLPEKTFSLWGYMWQNISDYANPLYRGGDEELFWPSTSPQVLKFWRSMYNRYDNDIHPREKVMDAISSIIDHNDSLLDHIKFLSSNYSCTACSGDRNFIDMKLGNLMYEVPVGNSSDSTPLANSLNGVEVDTAQPGSHTSDEDSLSWSSSIFSTYTSDASYISQDSGIGKTVPDDLQISLKRQGLTVDDLLESIPPFVVEWHITVGTVEKCSVNDVLTNNAHYQVITQIIASQSARIATRPSRNIN